MRKYYTESRGRGISYIKRGKADWIGHILSKICFLKHMVEGKVERGLDVTGRQGKRCKQLLGDRKERKGY